MVGQQIPASPYPFIIPQIGCGVKENNGYEKPTYLWDTLQTCRQSHANMKGVGEAGRCDSW